MSIYSSVECDAWCRDFDYDGYLDLHKKSGCLGATLSYAAYQAFRHLMHDEMVRTFVADIRNNANPS